MFRITFIRFVFLTLSSFLLLQQFNCIPIPDDSNKPDPFAQEAADALDSALWFLKDSITQLIEDSNKINKVFMNVTEMLGRLAPTDVKMQDEETHKKLHEQTLRANRTLNELLAKEKDQLS